jgi:hypothetical protein
VNESSCKPHKSNLVGFVQAPFRHLAICPQPSPR